uniref:Major core protein n=1 Tax=Thrips tabaci associated reovirus 1 TaxID=2771483 RepID=A0A7H1D338_9REOV|nr:major core protein [Thrips tabaci associated reovirus 1]
MALQLDYAGNASSNLVTEIDVEKIVTSLGSTASSFGVVQIQSVVKYNAVLAKASVAPTVTRLPLKPLFIKISELPKLHDVRVINLRDFHGQASDVTATYVLMQPTQSFLDSFMPVFKTYSDLTLLNAKLYFAAAELVAKHGRYVLSDVETLPGPSIATKPHIDLSKLGEYDITKHLIKIKNDRVRETVLLDTATLYVENKPGEVPNQFRDGSLYAHPGYGMKENHHAYREAIVPISSIHKTLLEAGLALLISQTYHPLRYVEDVQKLLPGNLTIDVNDITKLNGYDAKYRVPRLKKAFVDQNLLYRMPALLTEIRRDIRGCISGDFMLKPNIQTITISLSQALGISSNAQRAGDVIYRYLAMTEIPLLAEAIYPLWINPNLYYVDFSITAYSLSQEPFEMMAMLLSTVFIPPECIPAATRVKINNMICNFILLIKLSPQNREVYNLVNDFPGQALGWANNGNTDYLSLLYNRSRVRLAAGPPNAASTIRALDNYFNSNAPGAVTVPVNTIVDQHEVTHTAGIILPYLNGRPNYNHNLSPVHTDVRRSIFNDGRSVIYPTDFVDADGLPSTVHFLRKIDFLRELFSNLHMRPSSLPSEQALNALFDMLRVSTPVGVSQFYVKYFEHISKLMLSPFIDGVDRGIVRIGEKERKTISTKAVMAIPLFLAEPDPISVYISPVSPVVNTRITQATIFLNVFREIKRITQPAENAGVLFPGMLNPMTVHKRDMIDMAARITKLLTGDDNFSIDKILTENYQPSDVDALLGIRNLQHMDRALESSSMFMVAVNGALANVTSYTAQLAPVPYFYIIPGGCYSNMHNPTSNAVLLSNAPASSQIFATHQINGFRELKEYLFQTREVSNMTMMNSKLTCLRRGLRQIEVVDHLTGYARIDAIKVNVPVHVNINFIDASRMYDFEIESMKHTTFTQLTAGIKRDTTQITAVIPTITITVILNNLGDEDNYSILDKELLENVILKLRDQERVIVPHDEAMRSKGCELFSIKHLRERYTSTVQYRDPPLEVLDNVTMRLSSLSTM